MGGCHERTSRTEGRCRPRATGRRSGYRRTQRQRIDRADIALHRCGMVAVPALVRVSPALRLRLRHSQRYRSSRHPSRFRAVPDLPCLSRAEKFAARPVPLADWVLRALGAFASAYLFLLWRACRTARPALDARSRHRHCRHPAPARGHAPRARPADGLRRRRLHLLHFCRPVHARRHPASRRFAG